MSTKLKFALLTLAVSQLMLASPQLYTNLGSSPVNTATAPVSVTFSTPLTSPNAYSLQYGSEFSVDSGSCITTQDPNSTSCNVTFTPLHPGLRVDALNAYDNEGGFLGTEYVYGIGAGPLPVFSPGTISTLFTPTGVAANGTTGITKGSFGVIYFSNAQDNTVSQIDGDGNVTIVAGTSGSQGFSGDGGPATSATLNSPQGLLIDGAGNLYIADSNNSRVRKVDSSGNISTIAGDGTQSSTGDGGQATAATIASPYALASDLQGNLYIADYTSSVVRKVTPSGVISTYAGVNGHLDSAGDNGPATSAHIGHPASLAIDTAGNLYIGQQYT